MNSATGSHVLCLDEVAAYRPHQVVDLSRELVAAKYQIAWFKRQIFVQKSERRIEHVEQALGLMPVERDVLLTDGYTAYAHSTKKIGLSHAIGWAHTRRKLIEARDAEPAAVRGLDFIGRLYAVEARIRDQKLSAAKKLNYRLMYAKLDCRAVLCLGESAIRGTGTVAEQSADEGTGIRPRASIRAGGLSDRSGRADRYQPSCRRGLYPPRRQDGIAPPKPSIFPCPDNANNAYTVMIRHVHIKNSSVRHIQQVMT
jgi:hypothetical protein